MELVDTHCHINYLDVDEIESVIQRALNVGVKKIFIPNVDSSSVQPMLEVCNKYKNICFPLIGLHPTSVKSDFEKELKDIFNHYDKSVFYAVGEIGLDFYHDRTFINEQLYVLKKQIDFALNEDLAVNIHVRNSFNEVLKLLKEYKNQKFKGIFHCYSGNVIQAHEVIKMGFSLGIGGVVTYKNSGMAEVVKEIDLENIVLETDSPWLTPVPFRGQKNEPSFILNIAQKVAEIKNISVEQVAYQTTVNAEKIYSRVC